MSRGTVLITGATSGIGRALAADYHRAGWRVIACGRDITRLRRAPASRHLRFSVQNLPQTLGAAADLDETIDLLILNAGTCEYIDDAGRFDARLMQRVMGTNVIGVANCLEAFVPRLRRGGQLALMGSAASHFPFSRAEAYGASKAAIAYLARALRVDLQALGIAVSLVQPGFVDTPLTQRNDFSMPGLISAERASAAIRRGLQRRQHTVYTPRLLNWVLRALGALPDPLPTLIAARLRRP